MNLIDLKPTTKPPTFPALQDMNYHTTYSRVTRSPHWNCPVESTPVLVSEHNCRSCGLTFNCMRMHSYYVDVSHIITHPLSHIYAQCKHPTCLNTFMHVYTHVHTCICTSIKTWTHKHTHNTHTNNTHAYTHIHMHEHMHMHTHTHLMKGKIREDDSNIVLNTYNQSSIPLIPTSYYFNMIPHLKELA